jgi:hypothetical protein
MTTMTRDTLPVAAGGYLTIKIAPAACAAGDSSEIRILIEATPHRLLLSTIEVQQLAERCAMMTKALGSWRDLSNVSDEEAIIDRLLALHCLDDDQGLSTISLTVLDGRVTLTQRQLGAFEIAVTCLAQNLRWSMPPALQVKKRKAVRSSIICLYHQADKTLWNELRLHLNLVARQCPAYTWSFIDIQQYQQIRAQLQQAHLILLGISARFLNVLYHCDLYNDLVHLSEHWSYGGDSRIVVLRMQRVNWAEHKEAFFCLSVIPTAMYDYIDSDHQTRRNDAYAEAAHAIEMAISERQRNDELDEADRLNGRSQKRRARAWCISR